MILPRLRIFRLGRRIRRWALSLYGAILPIDGTDSPPRTLIFGATASVLHYNTFIRLLVTPINRLSEIPLLAFYDDLGAPIPVVFGRNDIGRA